MWCAPVDMAADADATVVHIPPIGASSVIERENAPVYVIETVDDADTVEDDDGFERRRRWDCDLSR